LPFDGASIHIDGTAASVPHGGGLQGSPSGESSTSRRAA
jgi:hypothetical protein